MSHFAGRVGTVQSCITIGGRLVGLSLCAVSLGLSDASFGLIGVGLRLPCIGCILQGVGIGLGRIGLDLRINGVSLRGIGLSFMRRHYLGAAPAESTLLLSYASMPESALRTAVRTLAPMINS